MAEKETGWCVVHMEERLRDGRETMAKLFETVENAIAFINTFNHAPATMSWQIFMLGKEIPLSRIRKTELGPPIEKISYCRAEKK